MFQSFMEPNKCIASLSISGEKTALQKYGLGFLKNLGYSLFLDRNNTITASTLIVNFRSLASQVYFLVQGDAVFNNLYIKLPLGPFAVWIFLIKNLNKLKFYLP